MGILESNTKRIRSGLRKMEKKELLKVGGGLTNITERELFLIQGGGYGRIAWLIFGALCYLF